MSRYILSVDQGTSSSKAIVFDDHGHQVAMCSREFTQLFPRQAWVEQERNDRDAAITTAINREVTDRGQAIHDAIELEKTNRDAAVANAKAELQGKIDKNSQDITTLDGKIKTNVDNIQTNADNIKNNKDEIARVNG